MRLILALLATLASAQDFSFIPQNVRQGEALKLHGNAETAKARLNQVTIPMFPQADGSTFGLMPIGVEQEPGDYPLEFLNISGAVIQSELVTVHDAHYPKQNIVISEALSELRPSSDEAATVHAFLAAATPTRFWQEPLHAPVSGCMNSIFGSQRLHNGKPTGDYHGGVDQRGAPGTPIHAVAAGTVRIVRQFQLRGGTIAVDHGQGLQSIYLHQSKFAVKEGQQVEAGEVIGYVGSTGRATGPHLHWSLYANGHPVNPTQWVKLQACGATRARPKTKKK
jgi:murein DD-endopeptidase MepM/ murein hydrolase activator NlpD